VTSDPDLKVTTFFYVEYLKYLRKPYLTYGMVPLLVTLTDLQTRRAALSASAELLVLLLIPRLHSDVLCRQRCLQWYNGSLITRYQ